MPYKIPADSVLLLEGGAMRGVYTSGVLDVLMQNDLYFPTVAAVSAGALNAVNYLSRQPGRSARINLRYRSDPRYSGPLALVRSRGLFGLDFIVNGLTEKEPFDAAAFASSPQRLLVAATNVDTGKAELFEKGKCSDFARAVIASASMPLVSWPVKIDGRPYLDGGCACHIPLDWALAQGFGHIVVVATQAKGYRKPVTSQRMVDLYSDFYAAHPRFFAALLTADLRYNALMDRIDRLEEKGRILVIRPRRPVEVRRTEKDRAKLLALINEGREEAKAALPALERYLSRSL